MPGNDNDGAVEIMELTRDQADQMWGELAFAITRMTWTETAATDEGVKVRLFDSAAAVDGWLVRVARRADGMTVGHAKTLFQDGRAALVTLPFELSVVVVGLATRDEAPKGATHTEYTLRAHKPRRERRRR